MQWHSHIHKHAHKHKHTCRHAHTHTHTQKGVLKRDRKKGARCESKIHCKRASQCDHTPPQATHKNRRDEHRTEEAHAEYMPVPEMVDTSWDKSLIVFKVSWKTLCVCVYFDVRVLEIVEWISRRKICLVYQRFFKRWKFCPEPGEFQEFCYKHSALTLHMRQYILIAWCHQKQYILVAWSHQRQYSLVARCHQRQYILIYVSPEAIHFDCMCHQRQYMLIYVSPEAIHFDLCVTRGNTFWLYVSPEAIHFDCMCHQRQYILIVCVTRGNTFWLYVSPEAIHFDLCVTRGNTFWLYVSPEVIHFDCTLSPGDHGGLFLPHGAAGERRAVQDGEASADGDGAPQLQSLRGTPSLARLLRTGLHHQGIHATGQPLSFTVSIEGLPQFLSSAYWLVISVFSFSAARKSNH